MKKINKWELKEEYAIGYTTKGEPFYVDLEDYEKVKDICWYKKANGYLYNGIFGLLHRFISNVAKDEVVDHINHEKEKNIKSNLRVCTPQENQFNRKGSKGYSYDKATGKYKASIKFNGKNIHLGYHGTVEGARIAYKDKAKELFGEFFNQGGYLEEG